VHDDPFPFPDTPDAIVARWTREFRYYRERIEQSGLDLWMDLAARLARVGVSPVILRQDIDDRQERGWTMDEIGPVLDALATETHRANHVPEAKHVALFARALFNAMTDRSPCSLLELAQSMRTSEH
jgi:hypothetical protein